MKHGRTIAVAGAGIGGMTAALALARAGFQVALMERAETQPATGAGIQLSPNAGRVLAALGLEDAIAPLAAEPEAIEVRLGRSGRRLVTLPLGPGFRRRYGIPYRTIHRADLQRVLAGAVEATADIQLMLGHALVEFAIHAHGMTIAADTASGGIELPADALIAADGVDSTVRALMPGGGRRQPEGRVAWRAVIPAAAAPEHVSGNRVGLWLGRNTHLVHYPIRAGREINIVAVVRERQELEGWDAPGGLGELMRLFRRWCDPVQAMLAVPATWHRWSISTVNPSGPWAIGPVALLGDAAHAMAPYIAQGGAMAIEDAAVIAAALAARPHDPAAAFQAYQAKRRPRVSSVWRHARSTADLYHLGRITGAARNAGMRIIGGRALVGRYRWIYRWKPP